MRSENLSGGIVQRLPSIWAIRSAASRKRTPVTNNIAKGDDLLASFLEPRRANVDRFIICCFSTLDLASRNFACGKGYFVGFRLSAFARLSTFHVAHLLFASPL